MGIFEKWAESLDYQYEVNPMICVRYKSDYASCQACTAVCPVSAIRLQDGKPIIDGKLCNECGKCLTSCPVQAISGIFPSPNIRNGELMIERGNLPSVKELLIYHAKGVQAVVCETDDVKEAVQPMIDEVNTYLAGFQKEHFRLRVHPFAAEELSYSRRELFHFWKEESKTILRQAAPANWRFNQDDFDLMKYHPEIQWHTIDLDIERCTLCKACASLCIKNCFRLDEGQFMISAQACSNCKLCADVCPEKAIEIIQEIKIAEPIQHPIFHKKCTVCKNGFQTANNQDEKCLVCRKRQSGYLTSS